MRLPLPTPQIPIPPRSSIRTGPVPRRLPAARVALPRARATPGCRSCPKRPPYRRRPPRRTDKPTPPHTHARIRAAQGRPPPGFPRAPRPRRPVSQRRPGGRDGPPALPGGGGRRPGWAGGAEGAARIPERSPPPRRRGRRGPGLPAPGHGGEGDRRHRGRRGGSRAPGRAREERSGEGASGALAPRRGRTGPGLRVPSGVRRRRPPLLLPTESSASPSAETRDVARAAGGGGRGSAKRHRGPTSRRAGGARTTARLCARAKAGRGKWSAGRVRRAPAARLVRGAGNRRCETRRRETRPPVGGPADARPGTGAGPVFPLQLRKSAAVPGDAGGATVAARARDLCSTVAGKRPSAAFRPGILLKFRAVRHRSGERPLFFVRRLQLWPSPLLFCVCVISRYSRAGWERSARCNHGSSADYKKPLALPSPERQSCSRTSHLVPTMSRRRTRFGTFQNGTLLTSGCTFLPAQADHSLQDHLQSAKQHPPICNRTADTTALEV